MKLGNRHFALSLESRDGLVCRLEHVPTGTVLADGAYSYSFGAPVFEDILDDGEGSVVLVGAIDTGITIEQRFTIEQDASWIEETITITNATDRPYVDSLRCGFVLPVDDETLTNHALTAVPFRREGMAVPFGSGSVEDFWRGRIGKNDRYLTFRLPEILYSRRVFPDAVTGSASQPVLAGLSERLLFSDRYAAEAWVLTDDRVGFLISKYNQRAREFAVLDRIYLPGAVTGLRWGGASSPDDCFDIRLEPGASYSFGATRLTAFEGDLTRGYYTFRAEMESRGHGTPEDFDPPVFWNEFYDNKLYWAGHVDPENRAKYYRLADMREEAAKAQAMGCQALYLDPGWETQQSAKHWDEGRPGPLDEFVAALQHEYGGLRLALHTPLSGWTGEGCDVPPNSALVNASGVTTSFACGASTQYVDESVRRLRTLAEAGVCFFMFDGTGLHGACWSTEHGHAVPSTVDDLVGATNRLARRVHEAHPEVLIEMHDQTFRYFPPMAPQYYGHGRDEAGMWGFDERWGLEFMSDPMADLLSGNSIALYYYNLAYSLPLYLHVDLRTDNENALVFWWTASTCRHLGIGGTPTESAVVDAHKAAMKTYLRLKPYFTRGAFYGLDEMTHMHVSADGRSAVLNCFNLDEQPIEREVRFDPAELGLSTDKSYSFSGGTVSIPGLGHTLIEII